MLLLMAMGFNIFPTLGQYSNPNAPYSGNYPSNGYPSNGYPSNGYPSNGYPSNGYPNNGNNIYGNNANIASNSSHHFVLGCSGNNYQDRQLFRQIYKRSGSMWWSTHEEIRFPSNGTVSYYTITCVRALDQYIDGKGGYASLRKGGIGYRNVTLLLSSKRGRGFNFIVEIYGRL